MYAHAQGAHGDVVAKALHFHELETLKDPSLDSDIKRSAKCEPSSRHRVDCNATIPERKHHASASDIRLRGFQHFDPS